MIRSIIPAILGFLAIVNCARAQDDKAWSVDTAVDFYSDYMFRGFNLYDGTSIQPSITLNYDSGSAGVSHVSLWMHLPGETQDRPEKFTEMDATLSHDITFGDLTFSVGHVWYMYLDEVEEGSPESAEFFASVSVDTFLTPTFSVYHDYREFDAQYYGLLFSHTIESAKLGEGFNITPYVDFGFASHAEKLYADNGLVQVTVGVSSELSLGIFSVIPSVNYTFESDEYALNELWVGLSLGYSF